MTDSLQTYDVLVAGGGLVGAVFAAVLAGSPEARHLKIGVVERRPFEAGAHGEQFDPRVVALTESSRLLLEQGGIWTAELAAKASPYDHMEVRDGEGTGLIEFDCSEVHQVNLGHIVENSIIVASAHRRLNALENVEFIFQPIQRLHRSEDNDWLVLTLENHQRVTAPLLVAADGAHSMVREHSHFRQRAWDYGHSAVIATIKTEQANNSTAYQWFTPQGPLAFLPLRTVDGDRHYSSIVWSQTHQVSEELMAAGEEAFLQKLGRASEHRLGEVVAVSKRFCLPLRQSHSVDYVKPGVALVGDAAHTIHPLAGQGVNLGFADVSALTEEIVRGLQRNLPPGEMSTLLRYQRRRKPDNLAMMAAMEGFKHLFAQDNPLLRIIRNRGMSELNGIRPLKNRLIRQAMGF